MGRKGSAHGPSAGRCFLVGPFRSDARVGASSRREASSPLLVRMHTGLPALQLRFLATPCLAGAGAAALAAALAAGWRALAKPSNILTLGAHTTKYSCRLSPTSIAASFCCARSLARSLALALPAAWRLGASLTFCRSLRAASCACCPLLFLFFGLRCGPAAGCASDG